MNNIGYAILKKTSNLVIDSNGLFEDLQLENKINTITNTLFTQNEVGQKLLCFKRVSSTQSNQNIKDTYLVVLLEWVNKNNQNFILGSAICFKDLQVNEDKIINGVQYLLSQLKRNFENDYNIEDNDLGVILPSTNKDFKIFKDEKLGHKSIKNYINGYNLISFSSTDAKKYLHHFCTNKSFSNIVSLLLVSSDSMFSELERNDNGYVKINKETLKRPIKEVKKTIIPPINKNEVNVEFQNKLENVTTELNREKKDKKIYRILSIILFCVSIFLVLMFAMNRSGRTSDETADSSIYPIEDKMYISNTAYNVNVRSAPFYNAAVDNLQTVLSDGDEVFVLGFDKKTLWAKISYNDRSEIGYVSNRFVSKNIAKNRIEPINKSAKVGWTYGRIALYAFPQEIGNEDPDSRLIFLDKNDKVFVKNKILKNNWYSVQLKKNNNIYNGFLKRKDFIYH
ncbi:SH3 domain-containing protein [Winogradskyella sp. Asnod2-B02-A]|uniref:SH3 domain-containing protein n=1 Tax=Winogradskyella sp. Asnod2-B02-A TaxID=3160583 RepID=UPI00386726A4